MWSNDLYYWFFGYIQGVIKYYSDLKLEVIVFWTIDNDTWRSNFGQVFIELFDFNKKSMSF